MTVLTQTITFFAALALTGAGPSPEVIALPHDFSLADAREIRLVLDDADVRVRIDEEAEPMLRARLTDAARKTGAAVEAQQTDRTFSLRRVAPEAVAAGRPKKRAPVLFELVIGSELAFELYGDTIGLQIESDPTEAARQRAPRGIPEAGAVPAARWRLDLRDSQALLVGLENIRVEMAGGNVHLIDTVGAARLVVDGGGVESEGHTGYLRLDAVEGDTEIRHLTGAIDFSLTGGQLEAFEIGDMIVGESDGGSVTLEGWRGKAVLRASTARVSVRRGAEGSELEVGGRLADITVDDHGGRLTADLDGGRLRAHTVFGPVEATGRAQANIDVAHTEERVDVTLDHANGTVVGVPGMAYFKVDDGRIEAEDVGRFAARGENAEAVVRSVRRLEIVAFKNSTIDLDLTEIQHNPALALRSATEAHIRMPMPCLVRVAASTFAIENKVRVDGCRFMHRGNMPPRLERLPKEGERAFVVNMVDEGSLDVEGVVLD